MQKFEAFLILTTIYSNNRCVNWVGWT